MNDKYSITILSKNIVGDKIYQVLRIEMKKVSSITRSKYLRNIMDKYDAFALIELYPKEGIIRKPKENFLVILIM